ncbi:hypothetical protein Tco_1453362 [Tanacetum coccineum]
MYIIAGRLATIQTKIRQVEQRKLQAAEHVGMKDEAKNVPHLRGQKLSRQAKGKIRKQENCTNLPPVTLSGLHRRSTSSGQDDWERSKQFEPLTSRDKEEMIQIQEKKSRIDLQSEKLGIQRRTLELAERGKRDRDILFYNSIIDPCLPPIQQEKLLEMKMEIKERYNLDY